MTSTTSTTMTTAASAARHGEAHDEDARLLDRWSIQIALLSDAEKRDVLGISPLTENDLAEARAELAFNAYWRRGLVDVALQSVALREMPTFKNGHCTGVRLETMSPRIGVVTQDFPTTAFAVPAWCRQRELAQQKGEEHNGQCLFELRAQAIESGGAGAVLDAGAAPGAAPADGAGFNVTLTRQPVKYLRSDETIAALLHNARHEGPASDGFFTVVYTEEALAKASQFAGKGGQCDPPVETGGVFIGVLAAFAPEKSAPRSAAKSTGKSAAKSAAESVANAVAASTEQLALVVTDCIELYDAEQNPYSLVMTQSWGRLQALMRARRGEPGHEAERMCGTAHCHPFLPGGANPPPPCEVCFRVKECGRKSCVPSMDDRVFSQAVFTGQPWHLCHIEGFNARAEPVRSLYTLRDAQLTERGHYVIPTFDPSAFALC